MTLGKNKHSMVEMEDRRLVSFDCNKGTIDTRITGDWDETLPDVDSPRCSAAAVVIGTSVIDRCQSGFCVDVDRDAFSAAFYSCFCMFITQTIPFPLPRICFQCNYSNQFSIDHPEFVNFTNMAIYQRMIHNCIKFIYYMLF